MVGAFDAGAPTLQVSVYEDGRLIERTMCETAEEAAAVAEEWESHTGVRTEIEDLGARHGPDDVLAPEPGDALVDDDPRDTSGG